STPRLDATRRATSGRADRVDWRVRPDVGLMMKVTGIASLVLRQAQDERCGDNARGEPVEPRARRRLAQRETPYGAAVEVGQLPDGAGRPRHAIQIEDGLAFLHVEQLTACADEGDAHGTINGGIGTGIFGHAYEPPRPYPRRGG